jgi:hypothetical protein
MTNQNQDQSIKIAALLEQQILFNQQNEKRFAEDRELMFSKFAELSEDNRLIREKLDKLERNTIIIKM